jgi:hypothetical protein
VKKDRTPLATTGLLMHALTMASTRASPRGHVVFFTETMVVCVCLTALATQRKKETMDVCVWLTALATQRKKEP